MNRVVTEIVLVPILILISLAFAWIPMLGWNLWLGVVFPELPKINYMTAFWLSFALSYLKTSVITIREDKY